MVPGQFSMFDFPKKAKKLFSETGFQVVDYYSHKIEYDKASGLE